MKNLISFCLLIIAFSFNVSAQLVNSLNFSTGYDNVTGTAIPNGPDPNWQVTAVTTPFVPTGSLPYSSHAQPGATTPANTRWVSYDPTAMSPGLHDNTGGTMTLEYQFETCSDDEVSFQATMRSDNRISAIRVDGISTGFSQTASLSNWSTGSLFSYSAFLTAGIHNIAIDIENLAHPQATNPSGLNVSGTISSINNSIIDKDNYPDYICNSCEDICYWKVTGNNIIGGNNVLGTNSPDDVILRTNNIDKGILTSGASGIPFDDGRLGWQTSNPTAHLHINCAGGNPDDGGAGSDVRFERLESGQGNILVIDEEGYVYNSRVPLDGFEGMDMNQENTERIAGLENEVKELKAKIEKLLNQSNKTDVMSLRNVGSNLFQNTPNPFGKETLIPYYIHSMKQSAYIMIYDLNGRTISKHPIAEKGNGSVRINAENLIPGVYLYSLVIDAQEIDSKKMVISKN